MLAAYPYKRISFLFILLLFLVGGCSKKDHSSPASSANDIVSFNLMPGKDSTSLAPYAHFITVFVPGTVTSGNNLAAAFKLSPGASATVNGVTQVSGASKNNFEQVQTYLVTAADHSTPQSWTVQATNNNFTMDWGLGHFSSASISRDKPYEWYVDQATSGTFALLNCGPASVTMAMKWSDSNFSRTALDARNTYESAGGWWYTYDIDSYLTKYSIPHVIIPLSADPAGTMQTLKQQLDAGQIVILCLDMNYIRAAGSSGYRLDKFYPTTPGWGHFIVLKGYQIVDGNPYFEAYDPYSIGQTNSDNTLKGRNRYYRPGDLAAATLPWWNYAFVITKKGQPVSQSAIQKAVNPATIRHAHSF